MLCVGSAGGRKRTQDVGQSSPLDTEVSTLCRNPSRMRGLWGGSQKWPPEGPSELFDSMHGLHGTGGFEGEAWVQTGSLGRMTGLVAFVSDRDESSAAVCSLLSQSIQPTPA